MYNLCQQQQQRCIDADTRHYGVIINHAQPSEKLTIQPQDLTKDGKAIEAEKKKL